LPSRRKNKRTLIREDRIRTAQAATQLRPSADEYLVADSPSIMQEAMRFFYKLAKKTKDEAQTGVAIETLQPNS
jgi:hypothetical protein